MAAQNRKAETKEGTQVNSRRTMGKKHKSSGSGVQKPKSRKVKTAVRGCSPTVLSELFPPLGSEAAHNQSANKKATDIVQAIYHDINVHCKIAKATDGKDRLTDQIYQNLLVSADQFMAQELKKYQDCVTPKAKFSEYQPLAHESRFFKFVNELGWKMFAICIHAEAFRRSFQESSDRVWGFVRQKINENSFSIELYAHNYELKWRDVLWNYQDVSIPGLPDMKPIIETYMQWKVDHPHHTVITLDGKLREPKFEGKLQEHIDESIFDPLRWSSCGRATDPTLRRPSPTYLTHPPQIGTDCFLCGSESSCDCRLEDRSGEFVELKEYPNKGTGVRTLTNFKRNDVLGAFIGELLPAPTEYVYPLTQRNDCFRGQDLCTVSPHQFGNWTRYINHSCEPSTSFTIRTIGNRVVTTVEALRDIKAFEELTVDYGANYWKSKKDTCKCGAPSCISLR
jgi:hypothetical protein